MKPQKYSISNEKHSLLVGSYKHQQCYPYVHIHLL